MLRVRIEAPSSPYPAERLAAGVARLRAAGCDVDDSHAQPRGRHAYLNGSDDERRLSLQEALRSDVDVVWLARGGYGLTRLLPHLEVPARAPILCGFSDATALFAHLQGSGIRAVHGPLATSIVNEPDSSVAHCLDVLGRKARGKRLPVHAAANTDVEGWLFAGNLCVLTHLIGTPSMPNLEGAVLVLEEVGERPYRIDRMLTQLKESGALSGVRAIVVGHLTGCEEPPQSGARDAAPSALDVFRERVSHLGIPMAWGLAAGHEPPCLALPLGVQVRLTGSSDDTAAGTLELLGDLPP